MADINTTIADRLNDLADREQIAILYACESGSRAWGFPSPDSDYDVRFIYLRPLAWYLSIDTHPETIDLPIDATLDINGWDLRKALKLFKGSNSVIYEWLQSPIVYRMQDNFTSELLNLARHFYAPRAGIYHYLNMATNCQRQELQTETVKLKKYFYALRPILAARWIVDKCSYPPMVFSELLTLISDRQEIVTEIDRLLTIKATANEATTIPADRLLNDFIRSEIEYCTTAVKDIPKHSHDSNDLDRLFQTYALGRS
jgi:uncharacterized protein